MTDRSVALAGSGALHTSIHSALAAANLRIAQVVDTALAEGVPGCTALVLASDSWDTGGHAAAGAGSTAAGHPWLPVVAELGHVVVGPLTTPGTPGCHTCAELRRRRARQNPAAHDEVRREHGAALRARPSSLLTGLACDLVGALVADEVARVGDVESPPRTVGALLRVGLRDLTVNRHRFLPDPVCPDCADLPEDSAERARITLSRRIKPARDRFRVRSAELEHQHLLDTYVDPVAGLVRGVELSDQAGLAVAAAPMGLRGPDSVEWSWGRSDNYRTSLTTSVLESLERWAGMQPGGKRTAVHASFAAVREHAVDPRTLGTHPPENHGPGFPFTAFDEDLELDWVWGYSFARDEPVLVPEAYAYYGIHRVKPRRSTFVMETSNGCALGGCLEEAILHAILEVAERDAFLLTWYGRMPVPPIDLDSSEDRLIAVIRRRVEDETGWRIRAFDTTVEQRIPCVWLMAVNPEQGQAVARSICTGGSHLIAEKALRNALFELGPVMGGITRSYAQDAERARAMAADSTLVRHMHDHSLLYACPEVFHRFDFLDTDRPARSLAEIAANAGFAEQDDLRADLLELVRRYLTTGLDVIVVDQTTAEQRVGGFHCVKVVIPGTMPMSFGHHLRRVHGLPRLHQVPQLLGYRDAPLSPDEVNPYPHPFP
ncbi:TOMM precursor leader peptide-binding protein [Kutzneria viridogrisea]|uniref:YcaO domain-containing protein n=2 Tax=Kutzneria TaxID=43356 RepID=W5W886_9PSEU|nr:TOMM precursor leader peptide-binding protein [Kutzneria albida]AHH96965.1 hypothetical protein KALB_3601 [Kutzneria albida DSM 43870]MBA8932070.1 ribosomal protein S12 methylthiotransferase accessory factor [Kutzneria viridogrisea]